MSAGALLRKAEWIVAVVLTALVVGFHIIYALHAGALWRDEIGPVRLATAPRLSELWHLLQYDSFPVAFYLLLRPWTATGWGATDTGLRVLGLVVGLGIITAVWGLRRPLHYSFPFVSLVLLGTNAWVIRGGDSVRAYGLGMLLLVVTFALLWRVVESPTPGRIVAAAISAVACAHSVYSATFLIAAMCVGGCAVSIRNGSWKRAAAIVAIGGLAALSLLPYANTVRRASSFKIVQEMPFDLARIWSVFAAALAEPNGLMLWIWLALFGLATGVSVICWKDQSGVRFLKLQRDLVLYASLTMIIAMAASLLFLWMLKYHTQPWYHLPLMAVVAISLEAVVGTATNTEKQRLVRITLVVIVAAQCFYPVWVQIHRRQTNVDMIASRLETLASTNDFILVNPWYCGVTFQRYYKGNTAWLTLPPIRDLSHTRFDMIKEQMSSPNPIGPVLTRITETLQSGARVWLVGSLSFGPSAQAPAKALPPAPHPQWGWDTDAYSLAWSIQTGFFVQTHAKRGELVPLPVESPVNPYENLRLVMVEGWR